MVSLDFPSQKKTLMSKSTKPDSANPANPAAGELGKSLRELRKQRGMTLSEASERAGLPVSTLSKIEYNRMSCSYDKMLRISRALGVDIGQLFSTEPSVAPPAGPAPSGRRSITRAGSGYAIETSNYAHLYPAADLLNKWGEPTRRWVMGVRAGTSTTSQGATWRRWRAGRTRSVLTARSKLASGSLRSPRHWSTARVHASPRGERGRHQRHSRGAQSRQPLLHLITDLRRVGDDRELQRGGAGAARPRAPGRVRPASWPPTAAPQRAR